MERQSKSPKQIILEILALLCVIGVVWGIASIMMENSEKEVLIEVYSTMKQIKDIALTTNDPLEVEELLKIAIPFKITLLILKEHSKEEIILDMIKLNDMSIDLLRRKRIILGLAPIARPSF
jgi:hypothetical protein